MTRQFVVLEHVNCTGLEPQVTIMEKVVSCLKSRNIFIAATMRPNAYTGEQVVLGALMDKE